ncbi:unnamed protein product [Schistosoma mattheei]|uniref:Uncharacterized protein n=1 Tax=Schistosoma mattheei TaxID=31246 RepID=A0A3P7XZN3_9TREM|nr:unnamed protein product [Schistosoma mattheei]
MIMIMIMIIRINIHIITIIKETINLRMSIVNQNNIHITKKKGIITMNILKEIKNLFVLEIIIMHIGIIK